MSVVNRARRVIQMLIESGALTMWLYPGGTVANVVLHTVIVYRSCVWRSRADKQGGVACWRWSAAR